MVVILFIVAVLLSSLMMPLFMLYAVIKLRNAKKISKYFHDVAFGIDQLGNVMGAPIMNSWLLTDKATKLYGNPDETISHVTGVNYLNESLTDLGYFVAHCLNTVEKNHVEKAAENEQ